MKSVFHEGEQEAQRLAGVEAMAKRVGNGIHPEMPDAAQDFLSLQPFVVLGGAEANGNIWAGILAGERGFAQALDSQTVAIAALPGNADPLYRVIHSGSPEIEIGLLAIEPATRRRMRVNGIIDAQENGLILHVRQAYANCPKYIQARTVDLSMSLLSGNSSVSRSAVLTDAQQQKIENADTFYIASARTGSGADASHRGGNPGFIAVDDAATITFPDYSGNKMFNTLGNLMANPRAGLLFADFEIGAVLQLTGEAEILWDAGEAERFPGAERVVRFRISEVIEQENALPLRGAFLSYSPFNPS